MYLGTLIPLLNLKLAIDFCWSLCFGFPLSLLDRERKVKNCPYFNQFGLQQRISSGMWDNMGSSVHHSTVQCNLPTAYCVQYLLSFTLAIHLWSEMTWPALTGHNIAERNKTKMNRAEQSLSIYSNSLYSTYSTLLLVIYVNGCTKQVHTYGVPLYQYAR